ncbi:MAG TPA: PLP-dependent aminotransferase family protein [Gaiellaceae bacterium]|nr:PLP-dependent aminotransferase family protein [Gaiellaceae bacterium]
MSPRQFQVRELFVALDRAKPTPLARQLEEQLREAIQSGRLATGQQLPSTRMLADELGISRGVVVRAYAQLGAEGYLAVRQGAYHHVTAVRTPQLAIAPPAETKRERVRYDLRPERPDVTQFPRRQWQRSLRQALLTATDAEVGYSDEHGLRPLREEIARYLARARGLAVTADSVVITAGSTHALTMIARVLHVRGEREIAFENPSHRILHSVARRNGLEPLGIPVDDEGLVVDELRRSGASAVVVSPAHQFPTGLAYGTARRTELLRWAEDCNGLIVEDDYNASFRYDGTPLGALQALAPERVAYIGSTSETLAPGLRLGWTVLPAHLVESVAGEIGLTILHLAALEQLALADFVRRAEFDRHLRRMRGVYRHRRDLLVRGLQQELPQLAVSGIAAGLHVVLELPSTAEEEEARERVSRAGIAVQTVSEHALPGYQGRRGLLIGYGAVHEQALERAALDLAAAVEGSAKLPDKRAGITRVA